MTAILVIGAVFVSCQSKDLYDEENVSNMKQQALEAQYKAVFEQTFGKINSNHHWGFDKAGYNMTRGVAEANYNNYELPDVIKNSDGKSFNKDFNVVTTEIDPKDLDLGEYGDYFVQHVFKQTHNSTNQYWGTSDQHHNMAQLQAYDYNHNEWVDVENFTGGQNTHTMKDTKGHKMTKGVTLMVNMGQPVEGKPMFRWISKSDNVICDNYSIRKVVRKDKKGNVVDEGIYVGLGYNNDNKALATDYDAWIIKLVKAVGTPAYFERGRIMCEDLGSLQNSDLDFNDVVFDATMYNDGSIDIIVQAAGGTLPIYVAGEKVTLGQMKNTGVGDYVAPQTIKIAAEQNRDGENWKWKSLFEIPVEVVGKDGVKYELQGEKGNAPGKFCTYIGLPWPDEYVKFNDAYPSFNDWVQNAQPDTWWEQHINEEFNAILTDLDLTNNK